MVQNLFAGLKTKNAICKCVDSEINSE